MHAHVVAGAELFAGDLLAHGGRKGLGATTGHRVEAGLAQRDQHFFPALLLDARDVRDLVGRQRFDVHVRQLGLDGPEHRRVVVEPGLHIEAADDVELAGHRVLGLPRLGHNLVERVAIRALFLGQARIAAEHAGGAQRADVRRVDVLVRREGDDVAVLGAVHRVGERADAGEVARFEHRDAVGLREPLALPHLFRDPAHHRIGDALDRDRQRTRHSLLTPCIAGWRSRRCGRRSPRSCSARRGLRASPDGSA